MLLPALCESHSAAPPTLAVIMIIGLVGWRYVSLWLPCRFPEYQWGWTSFHDYRPFIFCLLEYWFLLLNLKIIFFLFFIDKKEFILYCGHYLWLCQSESHCRSYCHCFKYYGLPCRRLCLQNDWKDRSSRPSAGLSEMTFKQQDRIGPPRDLLGLSRRLENALSQLLALELYPFGKGSGGCHRDLILGMHCLVCVCGTGSQYQNCWLQTLSAWHAAQPVWPIPPGFTEAHLAGRLYITPRTWAVSKQAWEKQCFSFQPLTYRKATRKRLGEMLKETVSHVGWIPQSHHSAFLCVLVLKHPKTANTHWRKVTLPHTNARARTPSPKANSHNSTLTGHHVCFSVFIFLWFCPNSVLIPQNLRMKIWATPDIPFISVLLDTVDVWVK